MPTLTVKNLPDELYDKLKQSAQRNHRSLNAEIIAAIEQAVAHEPLDVEAFLATARKIREFSAGYMITDEEINQAKSEGRP